MLNFTDEIPTEILNISAKQIRSLFPKSTLIHLKGECRKAMFVSVLLHGNETTGFSVLQNILKWLQTHKLKRDLIIFVGNVLACEKGLRKLDSQPDYNRIWKSFTGPEKVLAKEVKKYISKHELFAAVDIHNNTGVNPVYACVTKPSLENLYLASFFSNTVVYFENPDTVLVQYLKDFCPSIVVECGLSSSQEGVRKATDLIYELNHLETLSTSHFCRKQVNLYHTVGRIVVDADVTIDFSGQTQGDLNLIADLDRYNFSLLHKGFMIGNTSKQELPLKVLGDRGEDKTANYFSFHQGKIYTAQNLIPSMLTEDQNVIKSDCLGYFMELL